MHIAPRYNITGEETQPTLVSEVFKRKKEKHKGEEKGGGSQQHNRGEKWAVRSVSYFLAVRPALQLDPDHDAFFFSSNYRLRGSTSGKRCGKKKQI